MELLYKSAYGLISLSALSLGGLALLKNPRSSLNVLWALTNLSVAGWASLAAWYFFEPYYPRALLLCRLSLYSAAFVPVFYTHFCLRLVNLRLRNSRPAIAGYIFTALLAPFVLTRWFVPSSSPKLGFPNYVDAGPLFTAFAFEFFFLVIYGHWLLFRHWRAQPPARQTQIRYVALGMIVGFSGGATNFPLAYNIPIHPLPSLFIPFYALCVTYAIIKHQLMDIKVAVTRTGLALATYFVVLGGPIALGWWCGDLLLAQLGKHWWLLPVGLSTVLATIGPLVYARLRRQAEQHLLRELASTRQAASIDALTGVLTRRAFMEQAGAALARTLGDGQPSGLLMLDLDHFKQANDAHGHPVGDALLQEVAARLTRTLRQTDLLGRYGGEEFACLLPQTPREAALVIAERLRQAVAEIPVRVAGRTLTQTLSIGVAASPGDGLTLPGLIEAADRALYAAKRAGRNQVQTAGIPG